jgi:hypothetical protein
MVTPSARGCLCKPTTCDSLPVQPCSGKQRLRLVAIVKRGCHTRITQGSPADDLPTLQAVYRPPCRPVLAGDGAPAMHLCAGA